jgi:hypothetical protein
VIERGRITVLNRAKLARAEIFSTSGNLEYTSRDPLYAEVTRVPDLEGSVE